MEGTRHLPIKEPFIFAVNHTASFDHMSIAAFLAARLQKKIYFPANHRYYDFFGARIAEMFGMIRVDPHAPAQCLESLLEKFRHGHCIGIFPEGSGHRGQELKRGKTGVARLALWTRTPVVPFGFEGPFAGNALNNKWTAVKTWLKPSEKMTITIGRPLTFDAYYDQPLTYQALRDITDTIMRSISVLCHRPYPYE